MLFLDILGLFPDVDHSEEFAAWLLLYVLVAALLLFSFTFPLLTGYIAASNGRSFWRWYATGFLLPFLSVFIIMLVAIRAQLAEEKCATASRPE